MDTNVLLRLIEPRHPRYRVSSDAVKTLRQTGVDLLIVPQILYEFWSVATRPIEANGLGMSVAETEDELTTTKRLFVFLRDERAIYPDWEHLVTEFEVLGKNGHDTRLAAAIVRHNISHLPTYNDRDFRRYPFITVLVPDQL